MSTLIKIFLAGVALSIAGTLLWPHVRERISAAVPDSAAPV